MQRLFRSIGAVTVTAGYLLCLVGLPQSGSILTATAMLRPATTVVSCETARPPGLRVVYGVGGGPTQCFGGIGPESIGRYVNFVATTGHSGFLIVHTNDQCVSIPFGPQNFLRIDETLCAIDITHEE